MSSTPSCLPSGTDPSRPSARGRMVRRWALAALALAAVAEAQTPLASRLINLSVRTKLAAGENLITGFVLTGTEPALVLVRGVGPGLVPFGVADAMPNPKITLIDSRGASLINDDWGPPGVPPPTLPVETPVFTLPASGVVVVAFPIPVGGVGLVFVPSPIAGAFPLPVNSRDASLLVELKGGAYTLNVAGSANTDAGTVLAEVYDASIDSELGASSTRLINLSARGVAGPGAPLIAGFVVDGTVPKPLLLRVTGPMLTAFGVAGAAVDTRLELMDQLGAVIRSNDNWDSGSAAETLELRQAATRAGAFPYQAGSRDAAVVVTLPPGLYTLRGSGVDGVNGVVLLEIYDLQD